MKKLRKPDGPGYKVIAKKTAEELFRDRGLNLMGRTLLNVNFDRSHPYEVPSLGLGMAGFDTIIPDTIYSCEYEEVIHPKDANCVSSTVVVPKGAWDVHRLLLDLPLRPTGLETAYLENIIGPYTLHPSKTGFHAYAEELETWVGIRSILARLVKDKRIPLDVSWVAISLAEGHCAVRLPWKRKEAVTYDHNPFFLDEKYTCPLPVKEVDGESYTQSDAAKYMAEYQLQRQTILQDKNDILRGCIT